MTDTKFIAGNWKMNGMLEDGRQRIEQLLAFTSSKKAELKENTQILVCPPATILGDLKNMLKNTAIALGGQNCHTEMSGAYTGDISAEMLKQQGASYVIVGHSERRQYHGETSELISKKAEAVHKTGMTAIICIGETAKERAMGEAKKVIKSQLIKSISKDTLYADNTIIAYEPVWAIGTGETASQADIEDMHNFIRHILEEKFPTIANTHILYGGSVKGANAKTILNYSNVNGVLVGGASLKIQEFCKIIEASF